jgi:predicted metal-binding membrane protein
MDRPSSAFDRRRPSAAVASERRAYTADGMDSPDASRLGPAPGLAILGRDRVVVLAAVAVIAGLAWWYLVSMAGMEAMMAPSLAGWTAADFWTMFVMWAVMMVGMMLPSAAPLLLVHARLARENRARGQSAAPTVAFAIGYLLAWTGFSLVATVLQWGLDRAALLSTELRATTPYLGAAFLIGAGIYQLTPAKRACLVHCRSPLAFLLHHWRNGAGGAVRMGLEHGLYCIGCCWLLMALLFVGGIMNLLWIAGISILVLLEKVVPRGEAIAMVAGALLVGAGLWMGVAA